MQQPAEPVYVSDRMDERTEVELMAAFREVRDLAGAEAFDKAVIEMLLAQEAYLRATLPAHARAIKLLDRHHSGFDHA